MELTQNLLNRNYLFLFLLYFVQGLPYGLQTRFLPIYLRSRGTSLSSLGLMKLLLLPWLLKILWAPLFDWMQSRKKWLLLSILGLVSVCAFGSLITPDKIVVLCLILLLLNIFSSIQDIAVDALTITILTEEETGMGNTIQVVGYKFGGIFGGGVFMWLSTYLQLNGLFLFLSLIYLVSIFVIYLFNIDENRTLKVNTHIEKSTATKFESNQEEKLHSKRRKVESRKPNEQMNKYGDTGKHKALSWMKKVIYSQGTPEIIALVLVYKLGEQGCADQFPLYLVDNGVSGATVGFWSGVVCQASSIVGSILGGLYMSDMSVHRMSRVNFLKFLFVIRLAPIFFEFLHIIHFMSSNFVGFASMCSLQLIGGIITTATFTLMMQCSQRAPSDVQATHYTMLATLEVMGKLLFVSGASWLSDSLGYSVMFALFTFVSILPIVFIHFLDIKVSRN